VVIIVAKIAMIAKAIINSTNVNPNIFRFKCFLTNTITFL